MQIVMKMLMVASLTTGFVFAEELAEETVEEQVLDNQDSAEDQKQSNAQSQYSESSSSSSSYTQVTGFYAGVDLGFSNLKNRMTRAKVKKAEEGKEAAVTTEKKTKKKNGFSGNIFAGYNFQMGRFIFGAECLIGAETAKPVTVITDDGLASSADTAAKTDLTTSGEGVSLKRKYTFGFVPRVGYAIFGGLNAYLNCGTMLAKYALKHKEKKPDTEQTTNSKNKAKASFLVGLGLEQNFGSLFVRAECNKVFRRNIVKVGTTKIGSDSYVVKLGAGYRF